MIFEDYVSENSDSDDSDFNPLGAEDSGEESIDERYEGKEFEDRDEGEPESKSKKRKKGAKVKRGRAAGLSLRDAEAKTEPLAPPAADPEAEKKRIDALFADFLSGTEIPSAAPSSTTTSSSSSTSTSSAAAASTVKISDIPKELPRARSPPKIFEFAGETVEITPNKQSNGNSAAAASKSGNPPAAAAAAKRPAGSGLASVLNQLGKKSKLSVLEKTKLDWDGFKSKEGISEELKTHNRGREGFLERRDFLQRTDVRQFEIEKSMRSVSRRSNK